MNFTQNHNEIINPPTEFQNLMNSPEFQELLNVWKIDNMKKLVQWNRIRIGKQNSLENLLEHQKSSTFPTDIQSKRIQFSHYPTSVPQDVINLSLQQQDTAFIQYANALLEDRINVFQIDYNDYVKDFNDEWIYNHLYESLFEEDYKLTILTKDSLAEFTSYEIIKPLMDLFMKNGIAYEENQRQKKLEKLNKQRTQQLNQLNQTNLDMDNDMEVVNDQSTSITSATISNNTTTTSILESILKQIQDLSSRINTTDSKLERLLSSRSQSPQSTTSNKPINPNNNSRRNKSTHQPTTQPGHLNMSTRGRSSTPVTRPPRVQKNVSNSTQSAMSSSSLPWTPSNQWTDVVSKRNRNRNRDHVEERSSSSTQPHK